jgi:ribosome modulation factor
MTQQYDRTNTGIIGKNTKKEKDTHPDITGSINVEGREFWLNGWKKERNDGTGSFYSLSVKPKEQQHAPQQAPAQQRPSQQPPADDSFDSDIPF